MRILTSYLPPTSGKVSIAGQGMSKETPLVIRRKIGLSARKPAALSEHDRARIPEVRRPAQRHPGA